MSRPSAAEALGVGCRPNDIEHGRGEAVGFNWWRESEMDGPSVQEIVDRVQAEWKAERRRRSGGCPHEAPDHRLTVAEAHVIMQQLRGCRAEECSRKGAARQALIDAGRMVPDPSRGYR